jgi:hypothetical protein
MLLSKITNLIILLASDAAAIRFLRGSYRRASKRSNEPKKKDHTERNAQKPQ